MIPNFPKPFADELYYSWLARFRWLFEPRNTSRAMRILLGQYNARVAVFLPSRLGVFVARLEDPAVSAETIIRDHTLVPVYAPFITPDRLARVQTNLTRGDLALGSGVANLSFQNPDRLRYCPVCAAEERARSGEAYWHRAHQMGGVLACSIHHAVLEYSEVQSRSLNNLIPAEDVVPVLPPRNVVANSREGALILKIATDVQWLLQNSVGGNSIESLNDRYFRLASMRGYISKGGHVLWKKVLPDLQERYPVSALESLQCAIPEKAFTFRPSWVSMLLQGRQKAQHPIRHLVMMDFLGVSAKEFFAPEERIRVFDTRLRECSNPICPKRGQAFIPALSNCGPKKKPGTVFMHCSECGRKSYRSTSDGHEHESICEYGRLWDEKLTELWGDGSLSIVKIGMQLGVGTPVIKRHATRLNLPFPRSTGRYVSVLTRLTRFCPGTTLRSARRDRWTTLRSLNPSFSSSELQSQEPTCYGWLYKNDRVWLRENCPARRKPPSPWQVKQLPDVGECATIP